MSAVVGPNEFSLKRGEDRHRDYMLTNLVRMDSTSDGPGQALLTPGLPVPGSIWQVGNDTDAWAFCKWDADVQRHGVKDEPNVYFTVRQRFSTKPDKTCQTSQFENPLLEPAKVSGSFIRRTREATQDMFGNPLVTSSWEQLRGQQVEFDDSTPQIVVEQNVALLQYDLLASLRNNVNDAPLWGFPARCVKLADIKWERAWYGTCYYYYKRTLTFEVLFETHDRYVLDEGNMALRGKWDKNPSSPTYKQYVLDSDIASDTNAWLNPRNFVKFKDWNGENKKVLLNGAGRPYDPGYYGGSTGTGSGTGADTQAGFRFIQYYPQSNLLLLNLPSIL